MKKHPGDPLNLDFDDLREAMLPAAAPLSLAISVAFLWRYLPGPDFRWQESVLGLSATLAALVAWVLARRHAMAGAMVLALGHLAISLFASFALPAGAGTILFALAIATCTLLAVPQATAAFAALAIGCQVGLHLLWQPQPYLELSLFAFAAIAVSLCASSGSQTRVLRWSWQRHSYALRLADELRDRQGQLNRTVKALDLAYRLLQRTNHELAQARQEAEEARQLKERFATNISHELRTPLNLVMGFSEMMYASPDVYGDVNWTAALRRDIAQVYAASRHLLQLVDDVLDLSRLNGERVPLRKSPCSVNDIVTEAADAVRDLLRAAKVGDRRPSLRLELDPAVPRLWLDGGRMRQVMLNLLNNAVRFTDEGEIIVRTERDEHEVHVSVSDTGVGTPASELEAIFDEFYQSEAAASRPGGGMGLGLAISKRFVLMHGGRIWAQSPAEREPLTDAEGPGCTFHVALPLDGGHAMASRLRTSRPAVVPGSPYADSVLLVGPPGVPMPDVARLLERYLGDYHVLCPESYDEAQRLAQERHPRAIVHNLALADLRRLTGQLLPASLERSIPVIYTAIPCTAWRAEMLGVHASLRKPLSRDELVARLRALPGRAGPVATEGDGVPVGQGDTPDGQGEALVGPRDVLVVDDDPGFTEVVARMLQATSRHYQVRTAFSGAEGLEEMRRQPPEVLILDLRLPEMDGPAFLAHMRADSRLAGVPVIIVTAMDVEEEPGGLESGLVAMAQRAGWELGDSLKAVGALLALARPRYERDGLPAASPAPAHP